MGRVSKYKKIKALDPYSKQNKHQNRKNKSLLLGSCWDENEIRQKKLEKRLQKQLQRRSTKAKKNKNVGPVSSSKFFDLPPDDIEDEFDMSTLTVRRNENTSPSLKKQLSVEIVSGSNRRLQHQNQTFVGEEANRELQQELKTSRLLKIGSISNKSSYRNDDRTTQKVHGRLEGESMKAFTRRINQETAMILKKNLTQQQNGSISRLKQVNPEKYEKKIHYLNKKKEKKRQMPTIRINQQKYSFEQGGERTTENLITGEYASQQAVSLLHDQVERPPTFSVLPRGAKLLLSSRNNNKDCLMSKEKSSNISKELEQYRARVQAQYALIKEQKRSTI
jgi:hypothetical protein